MPVRLITDMRSIQNIIFKIIVVICVSTQSLRESLQGSGTASIASP